MVANRCRDSLSFSETWSESVPGFEVSPRRIERNIVTCVMSQAWVSVKIRRQRRLRALDPVAREGKCTKARNFPAGGEGSNPSRIHIPYRIYSIHSTFILVRKSP